VWLLWLCLAASEGRDCLSASSPACLIKQGCRPICAARTSVSMLWSTRPADLPVIGVKTDAFETLVANSPRTSTLSHGYVTYVHSITLYLLHRTCSCIHHHQHHHPPCSPETPRAAALGTHAHVADPFPCCRIVAETPTTPVDASCTPTPNHLGALWDQPVLVAAARDGVAFQNTSPPTLDSVDFCSVNEPRPVALLFFPCPPRRAMPKQMSCTTS
jgi:hypothetical protein